MLKSVRKTRFHRVVLKLSGETLGDGDEHISTKVIARMARQIKEVKELGIQLAIVIGGGNIWRGAFSK